MTVRWFLEQRQSKGPIPREEAVRSGEEFAQLTETDAAEVIEIIEQMDQGLLIPEALPVVSLDAGVPSEPEAGAEFEPASEPVFVPEPEADFPPEKPSAFPENPEAESEKEEISMKRASTESITEVVRANKDKTRPEIEDILRKKGISFGKATVGVTLHKVR